MIRLGGFFLLFAMTLSSMDAATPPVARKVPKKTVQQHETRTDDYFWLREKSNPEVIAYLEAENRYTAETMKPYAALQEKLYKEILGRVKESDLTVPTPHGGYFYYTRTETGKQYRIHCRRKGSLEAAEEVLLDENMLAAGHKYFRVGDFEVSPDHKLLAYSTDTEGDEVYTVRVKNLETGTLFADQIQGAYYGIEWAADNRTLFYTTVDAAKRPYKVFRHTLEQAARTDALVYHETDERFNADVQKTKDGAFLFIHLRSSITAEYRYLKATEPTGEFQVLYARTTNVRYSVAHHGSAFYIRTNEGAQNFRLVKVSDAAPAKENWQEVIAGTAEVYLENVDAFRDHLVVGERDQGLRRLRILNLKSGESHFIAFPEVAYTVFQGANPEFATATLRFQYTSLVTPLSVYDYDMNTRARVLKKQYEVLGGYKPEDYQTERIFATAKDGTRIPMSLVYRKGLRRDGKNPTLLYGYGAYGSSTEPVFSSDRLSLLDRGFIWAIGHIRGGSEMGERWHDEGKMRHKKNTFRDFVACAEKLIEDKYTSTPKLAIMGGSAGGLLVGATLNLRPDLFRAAIAKVPFVDVINTISDPTLPLTAIEWEEWGNPISNQTEYEYMKSYSPYDNVQQAAYPLMLVTAGLNDPRVSYWEPAKWVAKLRATKTDKNTLLLKTNMGAGHFGASGRYERFRETAFDYSFLLMALGVE
jgi:oligopeptidase B